MAGKYLEKFRIETMRLQTHDYGAAGCYFITIDTYRMNEYFGAIMPAQTGHDPSILLSEIGTIAMDYWIEIPKHYPFVELDSFIIMPNHIHGILNFNVPRKEKWETNKFGPQRNNLAVVIGSYKGSVTRYANKKNITFRWKDRYHEKVIWNPGDLQNIRNYIYDNPAQWLKKNKK
jgi:putative transposase